MSYVYIAPLADESAFKIIQSIASKIRAGRLELNLTQADLANRSGLGRSTVERLEATGNATFENMVAVLRELSLDYLFSGLEVEEPVRRRASSRRS